MTERPRRQSLWHVLAAAAAATALTIAYLSAARMIDEVAILRALPRATLDSPVKGPAIYRGQLFGPENRATPSKRAAAAHWWWVNTGGSKSRRTSCESSATTKLELRDGDTTLPYLALSSASGSVIDSGRPIAWDAPAVIDFVERGPFETTNPPPTTCTGKSPRYIEYSIAQGAAVEVVACYRGGALQACTGRFQTVVSLPTIAAHREHRADRAYLPFMLAGFMCTSLVSTLFVLSVLSLRRAAKPQRPRATA